MPSELENIKSSVIIAHKSFGQLFCRFFSNVKPLCVHVCFVCVHKAQRPFKHAWNIPSIETAFIQTFEKWQFWVSGVIFFHFLFEIYRLECESIFLQHQQQHGWFIIALIELLRVFSTLPVIRYLSLAGFVFSQKGK